MSPLLPPLLTVVVILHVTIWARDTPLNRLVYIVHWKELFHALLNGIVFLAN